MEMVIFVVAVALIAAGIGFRIARARYVPPTDGGLTPPIKSDGERPK